MILKFYFLSIFFLLYGAFAVDLINNTCKKAAKDDPNIHYHFCKRSFERIPKSHIANLRGLGRISINLTKSNATHTIMYIESLLKHKRMNSYVRRCLMDCKELYSDAVDSLGKGFYNFKRQSYYDANIEVGAAMDASTTCEDGFWERKGVVSPLTRRNNDMFELAAVALNLINMCSEVKHK